MGQGADASILARAEFMHQTRADASKYTWYNIPTKMLYDPAPLNDMGDPGWDMSAYANYSGGAQSYTYRRRTSMERAEPGVRAEPRVQTEPGEGNTDTRKARLHA